MASSLHGDHLLAWFKNKLSANSRGTGTWVFIWPLIKSVLLYHVYKSDRAWASFASDKSKMQNHVHWLHLVRETVFLRITFLGENFWTPPIGGGKMTETSDRRQIYRVRFDPDKNRPSFVLIDSSDCADIQQGKRLKYYYFTLLKILQ